MTEVKICGLTRESDIEAACSLGAAYLGFNFSAASLRRVTRERARDLSAAVSGGARKVGVFVEEGYSEIEDAISAASLDLVQVHRTLRAEDLRRIPRPVLAVAHAGREEEIPPGTLLDRCAGILFDVKPNGDYLAVRFNGTEDNVVLWTFNGGKRSFVKRGTENVPLELGTWNELRVTIDGVTLKAYLNGKLNLEYTLKEPVSGKVGLWSKTDSMSEFTDFLVTSARGR